MINRKVVTAISLTSLGIVLSGTSIFADNKTGTVIASTLNIRSGPSTNNTIIGYVHKGDKLQILETSNGWYKVKLSNGKIGWGSGNYINLNSEFSEGSNSNTEVISSDKKGTVTADALNIRSGASVSTGKVSMAYKGQVVDILGMSNGWYKVKLSNGTIGWASGSYIKLNTDESSEKQNGLEVVENSQVISGDKKGTVTADALNIRSGASVSYEKISLVYKNQVVEILETSNGWYKIKTQNGQMGWASSSYITIANSNDKAEERYKAQSTDIVLSKNGTVTATALNLRNGSSTTDSILGKLYKGQCIDIIGSSNGWYKIKTQSGQIGWASSNYINTNETKGEVSIDNSSTDKQSCNNAQSIINVAKAQLGKPYVWGSEGPNSFDCSGLVYYVYGQNGINMPRTSREQANIGKTVSQSQLQPGDLVFSSTDGSGNVNHVGIYIGNGQMIHAPKAGDVIKTTSISLSYWQNTYVTAKRVL